MSFLKNAFPLIQDTWNHETIYEDGDAYFLDLLQSIETAKASIHFETYIFDEDELGKKILEALIRAATRGVRVRLLLDGAGCYLWNSEQVKLYERENFKICFFHPMPWQRKNFKIWDHLSLKKITLGFFKLNHRNHRKTCTIDSKAVYLGSMNVSARHSKVIFGETAWRDTAVRIEGDSFTHLIADFENAWEYRDRYFIKHWIRSSRLVGRIYRARLIEYIESSTHQVCITTPYFFPDWKLLLALSQAATRGVEVSLLFPSQSDFAPSQYAARSFYQVLLDHGVKIYEYLPTILHAKVLIIDKKALVGSSNLNYRSLIRDLEIEILLHEQKSVTLLSEQFEIDVSRSNKIDPLTWKSRPLWERLFENLFLIFRGTL